MDNISEFFIYLPILFLSLIYETIIMGFYNTFKFGILLFQNGVWKFIQGIIIIAIPILPATFIKMFLEDYVSSALFSTEESSTIKWWFT